MIPYFSICLFQHRVLSMFIPTNFSSNANSGVRLSVKTGGLIDIEMVALKLHYTCFPSLQICVLHVNHSSSAFLNFEFGFSVMSDQVCQTSANRAYNTSLWNSVSNYFDV